MADEKISALPSAGALAGTEPLPIVQGGATKKTTVQDIADLAAGNQTLSQVLTAGNTSGANDIQFDATQGLLFANTSRLREGTIDAGLGGTKGIAQICAVGYELKWEAGRLYVMDGNGLFIRQSLYNFTTTPTSTDDTTKGYMVGSLWTLDDGTTYICSDATATAAVWALSYTNTPNLQQVLDNGNTSTTPIKIDDGAGNAFEMQSSVLKITNPLGGNGQIASQLLTATTIFELPNKATSPQTFAMLSDIGVVSVNSGTNISVDNTDPANPIINSLADRYSTSSVTSNTISNGAKTFTVDADLAYIPLQEVLIVNDPTHHMHATVTSYSGTTLVVNVTSHTGTGTFTSWVLNLDGVPVDAITGVGTVNEIAYFTAGQVIDSLPVATYPSLTELSYVKGVTSAIQTQLAGKQATLTNPVTGTGTNNEIAVFNSTGSAVTSLAVATYPSLTELSYVKGVTSAIQTQLNAIKKPISSVGNGTAVTGVVVNTYSKGLLIPANSRTANDVVQVDFQVTKTGAVGSVQLRFYWNTTNDLSGSPILLGTSPNGAYLWLAFSRLLSIEVANGTGNATKVAPTSITTLANGYGTSTTTTSTVGIDWTANGYLICAILNSNAADSSVCNMLKLN